MAPFRSRRKSLHKLMRQDAASTMTKLKGPYSMRTASRIVALTTLLVLAGAAGQAPSAWAQVYPKDGADGKRELKIFELKHVSASAVLNHWRNLNYSEEFNGNASLAVDERTNSILIRAPQDQIGEILKF